MEEEQSYTPQELWDIYVKDQMDWLASHYQKTNVAAYPKKLEEIQKLFNELKGKISESKFNKEGEYFKKFAKEQKEKYLAKTSQQKDFIINTNSQSPKKVKDEAKQGQQNVLNNAEQAQYCLSYRKLLYKNHKAFIKYLTKQRFSFQNIARHIIRGQKPQNQSAQPSFDFVVEKGLPFGGYIIKNQIMFYMFLRDMAKAILQLQSYGIFHGDISMRNIILCNCSKDELNNIEQFKKKAEKIMFKLIDFNFAFFILGQNAKMTEEIIKKRQQKLNLTNDLLQQISCIKENFDFTKILDGQTYKKIHSQIFFKLVRTIIDKNKIQVNIQEYEHMIEQRQYSKIIEEMNILITGEMKKKN